MPSPKSKPRPKPKLYRFEAIGTQWTIELFSAPDPEAILKAVKKRIDVFDKNYSRFRSDSLVTKMSHQAGDYILPEDARPMFGLYRDLYHLTNGLMTPLIGQTLSDAGYDANYSFEPKPLRETPAWDDCLVYNFPQLTVKKPVLLDFGAAGKGYLVDIIGELLKEYGCQEFVINAGSTPIQIALEHPLHHDQAIGIATICNQALCGSAGNRRAWAQFTHIMNPGDPAWAQPLAAVWVSAQTTLLADALTTALYFATPEALHKRYTFRYVCLNPDLSLVSSPDFPAQFFEPDAGGA